MDDKQEDRPEEKPSFKVVPEPEQAQTGSEAQAGEEAVKTEAQPQSPRSPIEPAVLPGDEPRPDQEAGPEPETKAEAGEEREDSEDIFASVKKEGGEPPIGPPETEISKPPQKESTVPVKKKPILLLVVAGLAVVGAAVLAFLFLKGRTKEVEPVTLTYWGLWEPEPVVQGIIAEYEKKNPNVKIQYVKQDKEDYRLRLQSAFDRGEGPDIFRFHQTWIPMMKRELAPVPQAVAVSLGLDQNYFPIIKETINQGGEYYGIPLMVDTLALYYNKDILATVNKSPPRTWWGLENLAKELTVRSEEKISVAGAALGATNNVDHWSDIIGLMIYQDGGNPEKADSLIEEVLNYYLRFKNVYRVWDETLPRSTLAFANGKLAFYFAPSWRVFNLLDANSDLNFGITAVPQLPELEDADWGAAEKGEEKLTEIGWASFWVEGVWAKSEKQKQAWDFLEFLGSKETLQKLYTAQSQIRLFGEIYPRTDLASSLESKPMVKPFIDQAKMAKSWYLASFTHGAGINDRMIKYYEDAINSLDQGDPAEGVLETLGMGIDQVLSQYGLSSSL